MFQSAPRSLDLDDLDQRFLMKDNTMMFLFHDPEFFSYLFSQDDTPAEVKYGRFLQVDFSEYVKTGGEVKMRLDNEFDNNRDYIEKICLNSLEERDFLRLCWCASYSGLTSMPDHLLGLLCLSVRCSVLLLFTVLAGL